MWIALPLLLACAPAVRRIPPPTLPEAPRSEVPEAARAAMLHASVIREQGDPAGARLALARARSLDPSSPWLRLEEARLELMTGDLVSADRLLAGLRGTAAEGEALALAGVVARLMGDPVRAEVAITEAMTRAPERWELWEERVNLLRSAGREAEARLLVEAWSRRPLAGGAALAARGRARLAIGDAAGAVDDLGAALALGGAGDPGALVEAARASGRLGSALGWLARADAAAPELALATLTLARLAGDLPLEIELLEARVALAPSEGASWAALAAARQAAGDARGAKAARARARALGVSALPATTRGRPEVSDRIAAGRAALADPATALALAREAVDRAPAEPGAWLLLADALAAAGRPADAAVARTRAARYGAVREGKIE